MIIWLIKQYDFQILRSEANPKFCVDSKFKGANERIGMEECNKDSPGAGGEQRFALTWRKVGHNRDT